MLDIKLIRERPDYVVEMVARKGYRLNLERLLFYDQWVRETDRMIESCIQYKKEEEQILFQEKNNEKRKLIIDSLKKWKSLINMAKENNENVKKDIYSIMIQIPNLPHESVPFSKNQYIHTYIF